MSTSLYRISLSSLLVALVALQQTYAINNLDFVPLKQVCIQNNFLSISSEDIDEADIETICSQIIESQNVEDIQNSRYDLIELSANEHFQYVSDYSFPASNNLFVAKNICTLPVYLNKELPITLHDKRALIKQLNLQLRI